MSLDKRGSRDIEIPFACVRKDYDEWAPTYDSEENYTRDIEAVAIQSILQSSYFDAALEFGCGTGKNTDFLAARSSKLVALDFSEGMLSVARRSIVAKNVVFANADIEQSWPVHDGSQHIVVCSLILQHIENLHFAFAQAARVLAVGGYLFVSELHPIKKYQGSKARYERDGQSIEITAFDHQISHYVQAAKRAGLTLREIDEWWHTEDRGRPPRIVTFLFSKEIADEPAHSANAGSRPA